MGAVAVPLVGRARQIDQLRELLDDAAAGSGGGLVITGGPGAGKTRLVETAAEMAAASGLVVRIGRAVDREVERTLGAALSAFDMRLDQLVGAPAESRVVLEAGATAATRFLLADRLLEVLEGECAEGPMLLVVEDLHWCDPTTVAWLRAVGRRSRALPVAVIVTSRPAPLGSTARRALDDLAAPEIVLGPLDDEEVRAVATAVLGRAPDSPTTAALDAAAGNPLLVLAVLDRVDAAGGQAAGEPFAARLTELTDPQLRTLQAAAVLGADVHPVDLQSVVGLPTGELLAHTAAAVAAGFLESKGERFNFRHDLYRGAVLATLSEPARAVLHLHAARTLAAAGAPAVEVAEHFAQGASNGDPDALRWLHDAALQIVAAAPAGALRLAEHGLRLAGRRPRSSCCW